MRTKEKERERNAAKSKKCHVSGMLQQFKKEQNNNNQIGINNIEMRNINLCDVKKNRLKKK